MKKRRTALTVVKPAKKPEPERFEDVVARMALPDFDDLTDAQWVARAKKWLRKFAELNMTCTENYVVMEKVRELQAQANFVMRLVYALDKKKEDDERDTEAGSAVRKYSEAFAQRHPDRRGADPGPDAGDDRRDADATFPDDSADAAE